MLPQLSLPLTLRDDARFENFLITPGSTREHVVNLIAREYPDDSFIYLWGGLGAGANHLIQACCHQFQHIGKTAIYLPLSDIKGYSSDEVLDGLEQTDLICIRSLEEITGDQSWEQGIFNLYNRAVTRGTRLIATANAPPQKLAIALMDLKSRLSNGLIFHLPDYSDTEKVEILCFRSQRLGLELSKECARFLVTHGKRDMPSLMQYLAEIDRASLQAKRRITIPFIKSLFNW